MRAPVLAVGDGALGFWKAVREVFPDTREQRCWWHKQANVLAALPKSAHPGALAALKEIYNAEDIDKARVVIKAFEIDYGAKYPQQFRVSSLTMQLCTAVAGVLVALTVGVAGVTFVRVVALTAFGPGRIDEPAFDPAGARVDRNWWLRVGIGLLIIGCLGVAALAPLQIRVIARGLTPLVGDQARGANAKPWVLQPVFTEFSALSPSWLWIVLPAMAIIIAIIGSLLAGRRLDRVRWVTPWSSASPGVHRGVGYTSFAYANPMRNVLGNVLLTRTELRGAPEQPSTQTHGWPILTYRVEVVEVFDRYLYRPAVAALLAATRVAKRLQSGRLDAYMAYMLIAVLAVLAVVIAVS